MKEFDVSLSNKNYILCLNKPFENFFKCWTDWSTKIAAQYYGDYGEHFVTEQSTEVIKVKIFYILF